MLSLGIPKVELLDVGLSHKPTFVVLPMGLLRKPLQVFRFSRSLMQAFHLWPNLRKCLKGLLSRRINMLESHVASCVVLASMTKVWYMSQFAVLCHLL